MRNDDEKERNNDWRKENRVCRGEEEKVIDQSSNDSLGG